MATIYDAPQTTLEMAWDQELSLHNAWTPWVSSTMLTPKEREGFVDRMKMRLGGSNPLSQAFVETVTNPWVLFAALMTPLGGSLTREAIFPVGRKMADAATKWGPFADFMKRTGMLNPKTVLAGRPTADFVDDSVRNVDLLRHETGERLEPSITQLARDLGLPPGTQLDPDNPALTRAQKEVMRRLNYALVGSLEGMDREGLVRYVYNARRKTMEPKSIQRLIPVDLDEELASISPAALQLRDDLRAAMNKRAVRVFGEDEAADLLAIDNISVDKLIRIYNGLRDNPMMREGAQSAGAAVGAHAAAVRSVTGILDDDLIDAVMNGNMEWDDFSVAVRNTFSVQMQSHYMPRNVFETRRIGTVIETDTPLESILRGAKGGKGVVKLRESAYPSYAPDDLAAMRELFGSTEKLDSLVDDAVASAREADAAGSPYTVMRARWDRQVQKYGRETETTYVFHSAPLSNQVKQAAEAMGYSTTMNVGGREVARSNLDLITDDFVDLHSRNKDKYGARLITHWLIPTVSGVAETSQSFTAAFLLGTKRMLGGLMDGPMGEMFEGLGPRGAAFREEAKMLADPDLGLKAAGGALDDADYIRVVEGNAGQASAIRQAERSGARRGLTAWLYASHLGFNMGSVLLNMTQPLLLAGSWMGPRDMLSGYRAAAREMVDYSAERAKLGVNPSKQQLQDLYQRVFKYADESQIRVDVLENLDAMAGRATRQEGVFSKGFAASMFLFEKAEFMNRSAIAHAVAARYAREGLDMASPFFRRDVTRMVEETQFGASMGNTPIMFQSSDPRLSVAGGMLNSPLLRQFFSFPLRSFTGVFGPIGGQVFGGARQIGPWTTQNRPASFTVDVLRGMGISAAAYEITKEAVGADMSNALYFDAAFAPFGGTRYGREQGDFPLSVPPVVSIPVDFTRALFGRDWELLSRSASRMVPGGIAARRVLNSSPETPLVDVFSLQKEYVDYNDLQADGTVPVYRGDGRLIRYEPRTQMILRAFGLDAGAVNAGRATDRYLLAQRDQIRGYKRELVDAIIKGDTHKQKGVREEFQKRYGLPLTVDRTHVESRLKAMTTPRTEELLRQFSEDDSTRALMVRYLEQQQAAASGRPGGRSEQAPLPTVGY